MFTANTMSTCIEALGMALPGTSTRPAVDKATNKCVHVHRLIIIITMF